MRAIKRFRSFTLLATLLISLGSTKAQVVVSDGYSMPGVREIKTNEIQIPTTDSTIIVKIEQICNIHDLKALPNNEFAWFTIDFKKSSTGSISPYWDILKTTSGKVIEAQHGKADEVNYAPKGWRRLTWAATLSKKNLKEFTKEPIKKIRLSIGWGVEILDIEFTDETLSTYIKEAHNAIVLQSKKKFDESKKPSKYENF